MSWGQSMRKKLKYSIYTKDCPWWVTQRWRKEKAGRFCLDSDLKAKVLKLFSGVVLSLETKRSIQKKLHAEHASERHSGQFTLAVLDRIKEGVQSVREATLYSQGSLKNSVVWLYSHKHFLLPAPISPCQMSLASGLGFAGGVLGAFLCAELGVYSLFILS